MNIIADHVAVLIMELAQRNNGKYSYFLTDLPEILKNNFEVAVPASLAEVASQRLLESGGSSKLESPLTGDLYQVHPQGVLQYYDPEAEPNEHSTVQYDHNWEDARSNFPIFRTYYFGGDAWISRAISSLQQRDLHAEEAEQDVADDAQFVPASDRIVSIDHNSTEAKQIDIGLDELSELIRADNSTGIRTSADRPRFIEQLQGAKNLLRLDRISVRAVSGLLLPILTYLTIHFADEAIGELAAALIAALKSLLGIAF